jgi:bifunctional isochorismate lyase/aryl carrier protein
VVSPLAPGEEDTLLTKWRYSAFQKTGLAELMQRKGRDQLIICGIYAHIGCLMTACEAFMRDIQPFYIADAVADFSLEHHKMALTYAAERCAVVLPARRLLDELNRAAELAGEETAAASEHTMLSLAAMREQVAELLDEPAAAIADHDDLINHWGLDSVRIMMLVEKWRLGGNEVTFVDLAERPTLAEWWSLFSIPSGREELPNIDYYAQ